MLATDDPMSGGFFAARRVQGQSGGGKPIPCSSFGFIANGWRCIRPGWGAGGGGWTRDRRYASFLLAIGAGRRWAGTDPAAKLPQRATSGLAGGGGVVFYQWGFSLG